MSSDANISKAASPNEACELALPYLMSHLDPTRPTPESIQAPYITGPPGCGKSAAARRFFRDVGFDRILVLSCGTIHEITGLIGIPEIVDVEKVAKEKPELKAADSDASAATVDHMSFESFQKGENNDEFLLSSKVTEKRKRASQEHVSASNKDLVWAKPKPLRFFDDMEEHERGLMIIDDAHFLTKEGQAAIMQLLTNNRMIHEHKIGGEHNVAIMFIGNRACDNAGAQEPLRPVVDRTVVIEVQGTKREEWLAWAEQEGVHPAVIMFIQSAADASMLHVDDPKTSLEYRNASARGWEGISEALRNQERLQSLSNLSKLIPGFNRSKVSDEFLNSLKNIQNQSLVNLFAGVVGHSKAAEFSAFYQLYSRFALRDYLTLDKSGKTPSVADNELSAATIRLAREAAQALVYLDRQLEIVTMKYICQNYEKLEERYRRQNEKDGANAITKMYERWKQGDRTIFDEPSFITACTCLGLLGDKSLERTPASVLIELSEDPTRIQEFLKNPNLRLRDMMKVALGNSLKIFDQETLSPEVQALLGKGEATIESAYISVVSFIDYFQRFLLEISDVSATQSNWHTFIGTLRDHVSRVSKSVLKTELNGHVQSTSSALTDFMIATFEQSNPDAYRFLLSARGSMSEIMQERSDKKKTRRSKLS